MFAILFLAIFIVSTVINSTVGLSNFGCLQRKNITLFYCEDDTLFAFSDSDISNLIEQIENQLGDCSSTNVYYTSIKKSVSVKTHELLGENKRNFDMSDVDRISYGIETAGDDVQQILVLFTLLDRLEKEIKMLHEKGWVIILYYKVDFYPRFLRFPKNRIFDWSFYKRLRYHIHPRTIINSIDVMKNPFYDRVELARKTKLENFDHSCFSGRHVVLNIVLLRNFSPVLTLVRNAIIAVQQFQRQEINFVFHLPNLRGDFFSSYAKRYGVKDNSIIFKGYSNENLTSVLFYLKMFHRTAKKRNLYLLENADNVYTYENLYYNIRGVCSINESKLKDVHFYGRSIYDDPVRQCDHKRLPNIHEKVDLYNQEHFMDTINDIVCDKTNGEQKDEL